MSENVLFACEGYKTKKKHFHKITRSMMCFYNKFLDQMNKAKTHFFPSDIHIRLVQKAHIHFIKRKKKENSIDFEKCGR